MPLTKKGKKIKRAMQKEYGKAEGERVFYASENKGTIKGVAKKLPKKRKRGSGELSPLGQRVLQGYETKYGDQGHAKFESAVSGGLLDRGKIFKRSAGGSFSSRTG